jgi:prevent-host-death family protein
MRGKAAGSGPRVISAARFKAQCLALMDEVDRTREEIIVTKRNRPVARLVALGGRSATRRTFVGRSRGIIDIRADFDSHVAWPKGDIRGKGRAGAEGGEL